MNNSKKFLNLKCKKQSHIFVYLVTITYRYAHNPYVYLCFFLLMMWFSFLFAFFSIQLSVRSHICNMAFTFLHSLHLTRLERFLTKITITSLFLFLSIWKEIDENLLISIHTHHLRDVFHTHMEMVCVWF